MQYTEKDLENLIDEKLNECGDSPAVCTFIETPAGRERVAQRIKEIILTEGVTDISAAIAKVEDELSWGDNNVFTFGED